MTCTTQLDSGGSSIGFPWCHCLPTAVRLIAVVIPVWPRGTYLVLEALGVYYDRRVSLSTGDQAQIRNRKKTWCSSCYSNYPTCTYLVILTIFSWKLLKQDRSARSLWCNISFWQYRTQKVLGADEKNVQILIPLVESFHLSSVRWGLMTNNDS